MIPRTACLLAFTMTTALAGNLSFQGDFSTDDQVQFFNFSLTSAASVAMVSLAYGGGTNAAGTVIPAGGFDTFFTLFASDGSQINTNDDGGCGHVNAGNGGCLDAWLSENLAAGAYTLALTQSGNDPAGDLSDGFIEQGQGNFTCPQGFCDTFGNQQNGFWAVDILNVDAASPDAPVPEPATFELAALPCFLLLALATRRRAVRRSRKGTSHES